MTTSEFIEMLKKADPEGTSHIRMAGGIPYFADRKEGYWDGPYDYIKEGKWVHSAQDMKVDIWCKDKEEMIMEVIDKWNPFKESDEFLWEKCKEQFIFDIDVYATEEQRNNRKERFFDGLKEFFETMKQHHQDSWFATQVEIIKLHQRGCRFFRKKEVQNRWYDGWKFINKNNKNDIGEANLKHTYIILESGSFEPIGTNIFPDNEYFEYVLIDKP